MKKINSKILSVAVLLSLMSSNASVVMLAHATDFTVNVHQISTTLNVNPPTADVYIGDSQHFTYTATIDGSPAGWPMGATVQWTSSDPTIATVDATTGVATGVAVGSVTISVTVNTAFTGSATLNVAKVPDNPGNGGNGGNGNNGGGVVSIPGNGGNGGNGTTQAPANTPVVNPPQNNGGNSGNGGNGPSTGGSINNPSSGSGNNNSGSGTTTPPSLPPGNAGVDNPPPGAEDYAPQPSVAPVQVQPGMGVSRAEMVAYIMDQFDLQDKKRDLLLSCYKNIDSCLSIFLSVSSFKNVSIPNSSIQSGLLNYFAGLFVNFAEAATAPLIDTSSIQLYPDVPPTVNDAYDVNVGTMLNVVQGYYTEYGSPFKPDRIISRIEALKVLLGASDLKQWMYYDELSTVLGGDASVKAQKTPFADVSGQDDHMWWYPRYVNQACDIGLINCKKGSNFRPDDYIKLDEVKAMITNLKKYFAKPDTKQIDADDDHDGLPNYMEEIYGTDPEKADTDGDGISDYDEIFKYHTSPVNPDTDGDGLTDGDEILKYHTDPLKADTDGDGFPDGVEIREGTDPLDPKSFPKDTASVGVSDEWQKLYGITVKDGEQDTDGDGLSDKLEYQLGTNPLKADTDGDGFSDGDEVLLLGTDPLNPDDPGSVSNLPVRIIGFTEGQLVGTSQPLIKGTAPAGLKVRIVIRNDYGHEKVLGDTTADDTGVFLFQVDTPIRDGKYMVIAKAFDTANKKIISSPPVHIVIDSKLGVVPPQPTKLADKDLSQDVILKDIRIEISDKKPVLKGRTEFGNKITATWKSLVTSSSLIADNVDGEFSISPGKDLGFGNHEVYVTSLRKKDGAQSQTIKVSFSVSPDYGLKAAADEVGNAASQTLWKLWGFITAQGLLSLFIIVLVAGGLIWAVYHYFFKE